MSAVYNTFGGELNENQELNEAIENKEIRNSEGVEYNESDMERIEKASEIMGEIFTDEVISNWENLSVVERTAHLNEYYEKTGEALGIETKGVYVEDLYAKYGYGTCGVNCGDGYLGIDIRLVSDSTQLGELLNTTTHEMRHQFQTDVLKNPEKFPDVSGETKAQWASEFNGYIDASYDFEAYESQAIETDARAFAEEVVVDYVEDAFERIESTPRYHAEANGEELMEEAPMIEDAPDSFDETASAVTEGVDAANEIADAPEVNSESDNASGIEVDQALNRTPFTYTAGQCARISTGTQNYCPFAGSGR